MTKFNPGAALELQREIRDAERACIREAVALIENDRPNAAKRLLVFDILEGHAANKIKFPDVRV